MVLVVGAEDVSGGPDDCSGGSCDDLGGPRGFARSPVLGGDSRAPGADFSSPPKIELPGALMIKPFPCPCPCHPPQIPPQTV